MRYRVRARSWDDGYVGARFEGVGLFSARFGKYDSEHDLSDTEIVDLIIEFGRATITPMCDDGGDGPEDYRIITFENDYD